MFGPIREDAVSRWASSTKRVGCGVDECYAASVECSWQERAVEASGYCHISLFCSLAEWACNLTDLLTDDRYDSLDLANPDHAQVLARFYTRILLVASELFADFDRLAMEAKQTKDQQAARSFLSPSGAPTWIHDCQGFINQVCKHKYGNIHQCNHHLPIICEDDKSALSFSNPIRVGSVDIKHGDAICFPSLSSVCDAICDAYSAIDSLFKADADAFKRICDAFNDPSCADAKQDGA
jgi:hypothetical protein